jgi:hypothetical protein
MHYWGDEWFEKHGNDLEEAVSLVVRYCRTLGRFGGQAKEKYGTLRFYAFFHSMIHDLIWPGYYYCQYPKHWMWMADIYIYGHSFFNPLRSLIQKWQSFIYRSAYKKAAKKYPAIKTEIYVMADYSELLKDDFDFSNHWSKE